MGPPPAPVPPPVATALPPAPLRPPAVGLCDRDDGASPRHAPPGFDPFSPASASLTAAVTASAAALERRRSVTVRSPRPSTASSSGSGGGGVGGADGIGAGGGCSPTAAGLTTAELVARKLGTPPRTPRSSGRTFDRDAGGGGDRPEPVVTPPRTPRRAVATAEGVAPAGAAEAGRPSGSAIGDGPSATVGGREPTTPPPAPPPPVPPSLPTPLQAGATAGSGDTDVSAGSPSGSSDTDDDGVGEDAEEGGEAGGIGADAPSVGWAALPAGTTGDRDTPPMADSKRPRTVRLASSRAISALLASRPVGSLRDRDAASGGGGSGRVVSLGSGGGGRDGAGDGREDTGDDGSGRGVARRLVAGRSQSLVGSPARRLSFRRSGARTNEHKEAARLTRVQSLSEKVFRMPTIVAAPYGTTDGASWSTDVLALFHNALKKELSGLYILVVSLQCRAMDLGKPDWRGLADWVATSSAFVADLLAGEEVLLFAWLQRKYKLDDRSPLAGRATIKAEVLGALDALVRLCATLPAVEPEEGGVAATGGSIAAKLRRRLSSHTLPVMTEADKENAPVAKAADGPATPPRISRFRPQHAGPPPDATAGLCALQAACDAFATKLLAYLSIQERTLLPVVQLLFCESDVRQLERRAARWAAGRPGPTLPLLLRPLSVEAAEAWRRSRLGSTARRPVAAALAMSGAAAATRHGRAVDEAWHKQQRYERRLKGYQSSRGGAQKGGWHGSSGGGGKGGVKALPKSSTER
ncbi:hypothetical protein MMPV_006678 [Pyropia vietnamensis]